MPRRPRLTWPKALDAYETHLRALHSSPHTLEEHLRDLGHLRDQLSPLRSDQVRLQDLRDYEVGLFTGQTSRRKKPLAARTVAKIASEIRRFFGFLTEEGLLEQNPAARLEQPKTPKREVGDVLTIKEVRRLIQAADITTALGLRDRAVAELLYATGVRRAELIALDLQDLCREEREVTIRHGKGGKGRRVPLTRSAFQSVTNYLERARPDLSTSHPDSATAFFLSKRGMRFNEMSLVRTLRKLRDAAKIKRPVTCHTLRRTCATHLLKGGATLRHIQLLLGHEDLNTLARSYLRLDTSELRREVLLKHPRERFEA